MKEIRISLYAVNAEERVAAICAELAQRGVAFTCNLDRDVYAIVITEA